jgi:hypothetical protein
VVTKDPKLSMNVKQTCCENQYNDFHMTVKKKVRFSPDVEKIDLGAEA